MNIGTILVGINALMAAIPEATRIAALDALLDKIEETYEATETEVDDVLIGALCRFVREHYNVPDND